MKTLSIVIPAYNEEENIEKVIRDCNRFFPQSEIIVVNDGSTDRTVEILHNLQKDFRYLRPLHNEKNSGHAKTLLKGLRAATGDYVLYIDADDQIKLTSVPSYVPNFVYEDIISGYRVNRQDKRFRKIVSFILKTLILLRHGMHIKDANCPFKIFRRSKLEILLKELPENSLVPSISLEILARKMGMKTLELPVLHHPLRVPRKGFLQSLNKKSLTMFWNAFEEVMSV